jgi:tetratricopeptide (TPR) repeat protein
MALDLVGRRDRANPEVQGYEVLHELGSGSMGTVYLARQLRLDRNVALKVLPRGVSLSARSRVRFLEEARSLARLHHENVVRVHDVIESGEVLAYAMDWVEGLSLQQVLVALADHPGRPDLAGLAAALGCEESELGASSLLSYLVQLGVTIATALEAVHEAGLVHRDVKPSNILIRRDGTPMLADFGLARGTESSLTRTGAFVGTPVYAPPEQLRSEGAELDGRADVYALAVTLFEAIAGARPFRASTMVDVLARIEAGAAPPLRKFAPHASRDLETILAKAMDPDLRRRYPTAGEFAADLLRLLRLEPIRARRAGPIRLLRAAVRRQGRALKGGVLGAALVAAVTLPFLIGPDQAARQREIDGLVEAARVGMLSLDRLHKIWLVSTMGVPDPESGVDSLGASISHYAEARALAPDDEALAMEAATVSVALELAGDGAQGESPSSELLDRLPAVARRWVETCSGRQVPLSAMPCDLTGATDADRLSIGLMAFLLGNYTLCEQSWLALDPLDPRYAFANAALGMLYQADGRPERAYPRLLQASSDFPGADLLFVELADLALQMGDLELAERWLRRSKATSSYRYRLVEGVLMHRKGQLEPARKQLAELPRLAPDFPAAWLEIARINLEDGDVTEARRKFNWLVTRWPNVATHRLEAARIALLVKDWRRYIDQVRYVMAADYGRDRSPGTVRDLLEILRIGGLRTLHEEGVRATGFRGRRTDRSFPAVPGVLAKFGGADGFDRMLRLLRGYDRLKRQLEPSLVQLVRRFEGLLPPKAPVPSRNLVWAKFRGAEPPAHTDHVMGETASGMILFGGSDGRGRLFGDTWLFDGVHWRMPELPLQPGARRRHAGAYDAKRRRFVMFGGSTLSVAGFRSDTWEFDGGIWLRVRTSKQPSPRNDHAMAYDPNSKRVLLFGGRDATGNRNDLWAYDGEDWVELQLPGSPPARRDHCACWDESANRLVVFGGYGPRKLGDTWVLAEGRWEELLGERLHRAGSAMAFDPRSSTVIRFSGQGFGPSYANTFVLEGDAWVRLTSTGPPIGRSGHALAKDPVNGRLLMFGGWHTGPLRGTWELR